MLHHANGGRPRIAQRARICALLLGGSALSTVAMPVAAQQQATADVSVSVAEGSLDDGLRQLSSQTGVQLIFTGADVAGRQTGGVAGRMTVEQAIARLLNGTGLTFRFVNARTVEVQSPVQAADGERMLGTVRVEGTQIASGSDVSATRGEGIAQLGGVRGRQDAEAAGYRPRVSSIGTGAPVAIEDVPRSLTVMTQEQIAKQDVTTITEALQRLPGVTISETQNAAASGNSIFVRGYELSQFQVDGGTPRSLAKNGALNLNLDAYERVELIRGPNALFVGAGSPGGSLNLVRKRPGAAPAESITLDVGSYNRVNAVADMSTPGLFGTPLAFRAVASVRREGSFVDDYATTNTALYGIFDAPLGDDARIEFGVQYSHLDQQGEYNGALRDTAGGLIDFGRGYNFAAGQGAYAKTDSLEFFGNLFVDLAEDWNVEASAFNRSTRNDYRTVISALNVIRSDGSFINPGSLFNLEAGPIKSTQIGLNAKLTGRFETFGLTHNVYASFSHDRSDTNATGRSLTVGFASIESLADLRNPTFDSTFSDSTNGYGGAAIANTGIVIGDTISWRDIVTLGAVVRRDDFSSRSATVMRDSGEIFDLSLQTPSFRGSWRPTYSITVKPTGRLTVFASYADGFTRQDDLFARSGTAPNFTYAPLGPSPYKNKEIGLKYGTDGWLASISLFDLRRTNAAQEVPGLSACPAVLGGPLLTAQCYFTGGTASTSRGVDFDLSGEIVKGLSVVASANYNETKVEDIGLPLQSLAPQTSANLFIDWSPSFVPGLGLQIGARYKSRYYSAGTLNLFDANGNLLGSTPFEVRQKPYVVADIGVDYRFSSTLSARLFVENVTDRTYLSTLQVAQGNFYGRPRTFLASLTWRHAGDVPADGRSPTTGLTPFGDPADWYAAFDAGYAMPRNLHARAKGTAVDGTTRVAWTMDLKNAPVYATRVGRYFGPNLRGELEAKFHRNPIGKVGGATVAPFGVCDATGSDQGVPFDCSDADGRVENWSLMANVLYDFGDPDALIRPFVGAGAGISRNSVSLIGKLDGIGGNTPWQIAQFNSLGTDSARKLQESIVSADTMIAFTWQAIGGASLRLSKRLKLDATYRFSQVRGMNWSSYNLSEPALFGSVQPLTSRIGAFSANYDTHAVTLGLRWAFGAR